MGWHSYTHKCSFISLICVSIPTQVTKFEIAYIVPLFDTEPCLERGPSSLEEVELDEDMEELDLMLDG